MSRATPGDLENRVNVLPAGKHQSSKRIYKSNTNHGVCFVWDQDKDRKNQTKHGISFIQASSAFFDPFLKIIDVGANNENRDAVIGMDENWNMYFVVHMQIDDDRIRIISARKATRQERNYYEN